MLDALQRLLTCNICVPPSLLHSPVTLRCGHSICATHLSPPNNPCPLPDCSSLPHPTTTSMYPSIPNSSNVLFLPPSHNDNSDDNSSSPARPPSDVMLAKVLALLKRHISHPSISSRPSTPPPPPSPQPPQPPTPDSPEHRARKRARLRSPSLPPSPTSPTQSLPPPPPVIRPPPDAFSKELLQEFTCEICYMLIFKPVTTPCQHTFCAKCLQRSLDHSTKCPLCRQDLPGYAYFHNHPVNHLVLSLVLCAFPQIYADRKESVAAEDRDDRLNTPIFVCQLSFPGMPTLLHFFEPRYRLMLRRCLEQPVPCFGMIMAPQPGGTTEYGTMLEIRSVQMLPDGRSMVETWGTYRFRIIERGTFDGYMAGRVERIDDFEDEIEQQVRRTKPPTSILARAAAVATGSTTAAAASTNAADLETPAVPNSSLGSTNEELVAICHSFVSQLRSGMTPWVVQRLNHTYGPMPSDISNFTFWMGMILPIEEHEKAKLLPIRSPRLRLRLLVHWIEQLNGQWWFMNGCTIM